MPTTVVNCHTDYYDVYIGRPSPWGNPFSHLRHHQGAATVPDRKTAIELYRRWVTGDTMTRALYNLPAPPTLAEIQALKGKRLGCHCAPLSCHGDVLAALADEGEPVIVTDPDGSRYEQLDWTKDS